MRAVALRSSECSFAAYRRSVWYAGHDDQEPRRAAQRQDRMGRGPPHRGTGARRADTLCYGQYDEELQGFPH
jgi:hypothetical protein